MGFFKKDLGLYSPLDLALGIPEKLKLEGFEVEEDDSDGEFVEVKDLKELAKLMSEEDDGSSNGSGDLSR